jgi:ATP-dependent helicase HrpB
VEETPWPLTTARAIQRLLNDTPGDILAFLPGVGEIRATADYLEATVVEQGLRLFPLHGELPPEEQDRALQAYPQRKIVLATNVAETSVTVEGITAVVDTGLARQKLYDVTVGLDRLQLTNISRASAEQRAGRAGRTQPGVCVRLWSESSHRSRPEQTDPEIRRIDLAGAAMDLFALGENPATFPWLDPPNAIMLQQALQLLERLGSVRDGKLTEIGQQMARLPVHPRLGRLMIEGARLGNPRRTALAAALLSERDPFVRGPAEHETPSDVLDRIESLEAIERGGRGTKDLVNRQGVRFLFAARDQLLRSLEGAFPNRRCSDDEVVLRSLLAAFPDRLCRRREPASPRGVMVGGRGVKLAPSSGVMKAELFLAIDVDAGQAETLVRQASLVERDWLDPTQVREQVDVEFDEATEKVSASRRTYFADLIIEEKPSRESGNEVLLQAAQKYRDRVLPKSDSAAGKYLLRLHSLRQWMPHLELPNFEGHDLDELLTWLVPGCRSFEEVRRADWLQAIQSKLTHRQRQLVEEEAPERLEVPSGSQIALTYEEGRPPILAVRIQEMFGLPETPRIAGGRVKVLLHLLAPNYRPQQVTDDLASFWTNTYPIVRKELRARYPKHSWPEDPRVAEPRRGTRKPSN